LWFIMVVDVECKSQCTVSSMAKVALVPKVTF